MTEYTCHDGPRTTAHTLICVYNRHDTYPAQDVTEVERMLTEDIPADENPNMHVPVPLWALRQVVAQLPSRTTG